MVKSETKSICFFTALFKFHQPRLGKERNEEFRFRDINWKCISLDKSGALISVRGITTFTKLPLIFNKLITHSYT